MAILLQPRASSLDLFFLAEESGWHQIIQNNELKLGVTAGGSLIFLESIYLL